MATNDDDDTRTAAARLAEHHDNFEAIARARDATAKLDAEWPLCRGRGERADIARVLDLAYVGAALLTHASQPFEARELAMRASGVFNAAKVFDGTNGRPAPWEQVAAELYRIGYLAADLHRTKRREAVAEIVTGAGASTPEAVAEAKAMGALFVQAMTAALMAVAHAAARTGSQILAAAPHGAGSVPTADAMMLFAETAKTAAETMAADAATGGAT